MKGLLLKDMYVGRKIGRLYFLIVLVCGISGIFGGRGTFFVRVYPALMMAMLPLSLCGYDERDRFLQLCATTPASRGAYVGEKYLLVLLSAAAVTAYNLLLGVVQMLTPALPAITGAQVLENGAYLYAIMMVLPAIYLPLVLWLGTEKGRIWYLLAVGLLCGGLVAVGLISASWLEDRLDLLPTLVFLLAAAGATALWGLSWALGRALYRKREL